MRYENSSRLNPLVVRIIFWAMIVLVVGLIGYFVLRGPIANLLGNLSTRGENNLQISEPATPDEESGRAALFPPKPTPAIPVLPPEEPPPLPLQFPIPNDIADREAGQDAATSLAVADDSENLFADEEWSEN